MSLSSTIYNTVMRKNWAFVGVIFAGAFGADIAFDVYAQRFWDWKNQGRQWKDIRQKYVLSEEE
ncbi:hypothetical protein TWF173_002512 [Orbilia oligospora]|uniref:Complex III subunit 9 n=1 Tax=Orbilia oligospora TaxID=2813651 RepID=A0A7C8VBF6_ORBOL|nr:hypothetical protein TWF970_001779 [Orbilia oligospora]KAF3316187.1 hypothetical protein TWF173_002512 [Orbilia oligospora]